MASDPPPAPTRAPAATLQALKQRQRQRLSQQLANKVVADALAVDLAITGSNKAYQNAAERPSTAAAPPAAAYRPSAYAAPPLPTVGNDEFAISDHLPQVLNLPSVQVDASQSLVSEPAHTPHPRIAAPVPTPTTTVILATTEVNRSQPVDSTVNKRSGSTERTPSRIPVRSQRQQDASARLARRHSSASTAAAAAGKVQSASRKKSVKQQGTDSTQDLPSDVEDIIQRFHKILDRQFAPGQPTDKQHSQAASGQQPKAPPTTSDHDVNPASTTLHTEEAQLAARASALQADVQNLHHRKLQAEHREQAIKLKQRHAEQAQRAEATLAVQLQSQLLVLLDQRDAAKQEIGKLQHEVQQRMAALQALLDTLNDKERSVDADYNNHVSQLRDRHASEMQGLKQHLDEQLTSVLSQHAAATTYTPLNEVKLSAYHIDDIPAQPG